MDAHTANVAQAKLLASQCIAPSTQKAVSISYVFLVAAN